MRIQNIVVSVSLITGIVHADTITVHNMNNAQIFCAIYYKNKTAIRVTNPVSVPVHGTHHLERPSLKIGTDRELIFSEQESDLAEQLSIDQLKSVPSVNIGTLKGTHFYIAKKDGQLKGYNEAEWKVVKVILEKIQEIGTKGKKIIESGKEAVVTHLGKAGAVIIKVPAEIQAQLLSVNSTYQEYPHKKTEAHVRIGNILPIEEVAATQRRLELIKQTLEKKLQKKIPYVPRIALVGSGGGFRAMLYWLGFLAGAEKEDLLNCITWTVGLSGSTWAIGSWMAAQVQAKQAGKILSFREFRNQLFTLITDKGLENFSPAEVKLMTDSWLAHALFSQPFTLVNFYGGLLANRILSFYGDKRQRVYLSDQRSIMLDGKLPIPIYTAVRGEAGLKPEQLDWYEFTPWEVGGAWLGMYVPSWAYGRKFKAGVSKDFGLEKSFGFNLGTYGSAFSGTVEQIYGELKSKIPVDLVKKILEETVIKAAGEKRLTWAEVHNFTYKMEHSPIKQKKTIEAVDGGLNYNLPYIPVSGQRPERKADILIFLDASATIKSAEELRKVEADARRKGLKFPTINYTDIDKNAISIFKNEQDPTMPVIIYIPRINDPKTVKRLIEPSFAQFKHLENFDIEKCTKIEFCSTYNFKYSRKELDQLTGFAELIGLVVIPVIFNEIDAFVQRKAGIT